MEKVAVFNLEQAGQYLDSNHDLYDIILDYKGKIITKSKRIHVDISLDHGSKVIAVLCDDMNPPFRYGEIDCDNGNNIAVRNYLDWSHFYISHRDFLAGGLKAQQILSKDLKKTKGFTLTSGQRKFNSVSKFSRIPSYDLEMTVIFKTPDEPRSFADSFLKELKERANKNYIEPNLEVLIDTAKTTKTVVEQFLKIIGITGIKYVTDGILREKNLITGEDGTYRNLSGLFSQANITESSIEDGRRYLNKKLKEYSWDFQRPRDIFEGFEVTKDHVILQFENHSILVRKDQKYKSFMNKIFDIKPSWKIKTIEISGNR